MERDAKYATVALFALACIAAAVAFIWWYSGRGDRRDYTNYEIYFDGSVSGLSQGSPVRYLGVDVGRVQTMAVDKSDPGRVKTVVEIDSTAPISGATQAKLGLLGLTGLLYIDLQQDPRGGAHGQLPRGDQYPVIAARKGSIEASLEKLPEILNHASTVMARLEAVLGDRNVKAVSATLANLEKASVTLPQLTQQASELAGDLRQLSKTTSQLVTKLNGTLDRTEPALNDIMANARVASEKLARTAEGFERLVNSSDGGLGRSAGSSLEELQQLAVDARAASIEVRELARALRERPSSLVREPRPSGVEIPQ